ncbi:MAG: Tad domain-containing protein [Armatimonadota bacterium]|nr:Tad domain-containing protein [Armatimonadota bacterium]MDR7486956.1 Tad domain-containing protein [Armatimonadota bacterium]MDR7532983.1 Tad domain-containing protein [Armatimonadota bacterium]MDR7537585.1 Tad domain-containing protein [Armatimonadota bacterium]
MSPGAPLEQRGTAVVFVVVTFLVLLLLLGMAVDFGILLRYRRAMQNACDAGVLAGALNLRRDPASVVPTTERYAENDMRRNAISWTSLEAATYDKNWQPTLMGPDRVRAEIHAMVPLFFLRLVRDSVEVAVDCAAKLTPVIFTKGLVPLGLNYDQWEPYHASPCWDYVTAGTLIQERPPQCQSFGITVDISAKSNPWGSGNTGLLSMSCFDCTSGGARQWEEYFKFGAPTPYCYDMGQTSAVTSGTYPDGSPALCANVKTETGVKIGALNQGIDWRCSQPAPPDSLAHIIMMPLLNPAYIEGGQGTYTTEIWGFVAFQLDCSGRRLTGANPTIRGGFVSIVSAQAVGTETEFDTGVYTIKLIE